MATEAETGTGAVPGAITPGTAKRAPKVGTLSTIQINLSGGAVQNIDKQVTQSTFTKYLAPWFVLSVSEKGKDKLEKALKAGDRVGVRNYIVANMRPRFGKLEGGKEGQLYQESLEIFESMLWKQSLGIP